MPLPLRLWASWWSATPVSKRRTLSRSLGRCRLSRERCARRTWDFNHRLIDLAENVADRWLGPQRCERWLDEVWMLAGLGTRMQTKIKTVCPLCSVTLIVLRI